MKVKYSGKVHLHVDFTKDIFIEGDRVEIEILVWNLLKNAIGGALEGTNPTVWISLKTCKIEVMLQVANSGRVFSASEVEDIGKNYLKSTQSRRFRNWPSGYQINSGSHQGLQ